MANPFDLLRKYGNQAIRQAGKQAEQGASALGGAASSIAQQMQNRNNQQQTPAPQPEPSQQPAPQPVPQAPKYDTDYYTKKNRIELDFDEAKRKADALDEIAARMEQTAAKDMENSMQLLAGGWKGENANAFLAKEGIIKNNIVSSAKELHAVAADIRTIARKLYEAEMAALRIATERKA